LVGELGVGRFGLFGGYERQLVLSMVFMASSRPLRFGLSTKSNPLHEKNKQRKEPYSSE
jgi:hypothetical protein